MCAVKQEQKARDEHYVKERKRQAEEADLMIEMMEEQVKTLTRNNREELDHIEVRNPTHMPPRTQGSFQALDNPPPRL